jgi:hypothetical protein
VLPLRIKPGAAGRTFRIEGAAADDFGEEQPFESLGVIVVTK